MKNKIAVVMLISVFFVGAVFFSGCTDMTGDNGDQGDKTSNVGGTIYVGGSNGLVTSFPSGRPPSTIYGDSSFELAFKLENKGEHSVPKSDTHVFIRGINPDIYGFNDTNATPSSSGNISGKRKVGDTVVPGGTAEVSFSSSGYNGTAVPSGGEWSQIVRGRVCYPYETEAVATVCLRSNIYSQTVGSAPCTVKGTKTFECSGAPIKITSVKEVPMGQNQIGFEVKISNVGGGQVYTEDITECKSLEVGSSGKVTLESATLKGLSLSCVSGCSSNDISNNPTVNLYSGTGTIILQADVTDISSTYEDILKMNFGYKYFSDVSKRLTIKGTS